MKTAFHGLDKDILLTDKNVRFIEPQISLKHIFNVQPKLRHVQAESKLNKSDQSLRNFPQIPRTSRKLLNQKRFIRVKP